MVLTLKNLTKFYDNNIALDDVSLEIGEGKIIGLLGPNGSGKSTMLKIIAGVLQATEGSVEVCGKPVGSETKALVSFLPERTYFDSSYKVSDVLDLFEDFYVDFDRARAEDMLDKSGINLKSKLKHLSKGTKEKVQLILVMSRRARLYLLDEPIGGVDPAARDFILNTVLKNHSENSTVIISTHLIRDVEEILDEYMFIYRGKVVEFENTAQRKEQTGKTLDELFREEFRCY